MQVIGMYQTLLGRDGFRKGMDLYFKLHDGTAVTCDDFRAAMADANGVDLTQFERWYTQAGTPQVRCPVRCRHTGSAMAVCFGFVLCLPMFFFAFFFFLRLGVV